MKSILYKIMVMACLFVMLGCDRNGVDDVDFNVTVQNPSLLRVGEPVTFLFEGNAEYISFFSGESGNSYANRNRNSVELSALQMSCTIKQQYTDSEYRRKEIVRAYVSDDFGGDYTLEGIQKATWNKISGIEYNQIVVPLTEKSSTEEVSSSISLIEYKDKSFYVAFQYFAPRREDVPQTTGGGRYIVAPRVDINPLSLLKTTVEGETVVWDNPSTDWAFQIVLENSTGTSNYKIDDSGLSFQPLQGKEHTDKDVAVWMVSGLIQPDKVDPDCGLAIKSSAAYLPSYSHVYSKPGTYEVTFVATNANLWNSDQITKQITIQIGE